MCHITGSIQERITPRRQFSFWCEIVFNFFSRHNSLLTRNPFSLVCKVSEFYSNVLVTCIFIYRWWLWSNSPYQASRRAESKAEDRGAAINGGLVIVTTDIKIVSQILSPLHFSFCSFAWDSKATSRRVWWNPNSSSLNFQGYCNY